MKRRVRMALDRAQQELDREHRTELAALQRELAEQFTADLERARALWRDYRTLVEAPHPPEASAVAAAILTAGRWVA